jgi:hypothetical protein
VGFFAKDTFFKCCLTINEVIKTNQNARSQTMSGETLILEKILLLWSLLVNGGKEIEYDLP